MKITAIILAAGLSRRMKRNKMNLHIDGDSMLQKVFDTVRKTRFHEIIVVMNDQTLPPRGSYKSVMNKNPELGVSHSIRLGIDEADPQTQGYVFLMGDQPFLEVDTLKRLKHHFVKRTMRITVPLYNNEPGSPVFFPAFLKEELRNLSGDKGGRQIIERHRELVVYDTTTAAHEGVDIDTKEEYEAHTARPTVLVRGAGDLASGVIRALAQRGYHVIATETEKPSCIRTEVSYASAIYEGRKSFGGVTAVKAENMEDIQAALASDQVPVIVDPALNLLQDIDPDIVVDAVIAKRNTGTTMDLAPIVIAMGPGFTAGKDCHAVIETMRGDDLGRIITKGSALPNTGVPGILHGEAEKRVIHSPADGILKRVRKIGDIVKADEIIAMIGDTPVTSKLPGTLRGLIYDGFEVQTGLKIADVDPRTDPSLALTISDKADLLGQSVITAIAQLKKDRVPLTAKSQE